MKTRLLVLFAVIFSASVAQAQINQICFDPSVYGYDMNGVGKMSVWPSVIPSGLSADSGESGWHSELSVAAWHSTLLKAQEMGKKVGIGYIYETGEIVYVGAPITCTTNEITVMEQ